jgi:hypothetical protein
MLAGCILPKYVPFWSLFNTGAPSWVTVSGELFNGCQTPLPVGSCSFTNTTNMTILFPNSSSVINWMNITSTTIVGGAIGATGSSKANFTITNGSSSIVGEVYVTFGLGYGGLATNITQLNFSRATAIAPAVVTNGSTNLSFSTASMNITMHIEGQAAANTNNNPNSVNANVSFIYMNGTTEPTIPVIVSATILPVASYTTNNLTGYCNASIEFPANLNYNFSWYKNGVLNTSGAFNNTTQGVNTNVGNMSNTSLTFGDLWILQCLAYNANGSSSALNSSGVPILGNLNSSYGTGILKLSFKPIHAFAQNVEPVNQTSTVGLFKINNTANFVTRVVAKLNASITGFSMKCTDSYSASVATVVTTNWTNISTIAALTNGTLWCWADFSNPQPRGQTFNITVDGIKYA